jgi:hypothetical protein
LVGLKQATTLALPSQRKPNAVQQGCRYSGLPEHEHADDDSCQEVMFKLQDAVAIIWRFIKY